ncbi:MAG: PDZ domain-containing protein [Ignavibacteriaceae bacterium]
MKKISTIIAFILFTNFFTYLRAQSITYEVDVSKPQDDLFHVTVFTNGLSTENDVYNLPATVPGTYSIQDFGRFVQSFKAYDQDGNELETEKISTNQWQINNAEKLAMIKYDSEDSFDANMTEHRIFGMEGTGIENNFIVLNTFGVLGYFEGLQSTPVKLKIKFNPNWLIGTALEMNDDRYYVAESYDYLADSPILIGDLTYAKTRVNDINVEAYVYSADTSFNASKFMNVADDILQSAGKFIGYSPVTHYDFLFCSVDGETFTRNHFVGAGALEHSYSSLFVFPPASGVSKEIKDDIAHEFLHILTPLNLHSNIIQPFNFETPTASQHLWLYEGVTEWGSDISQLRGGLIPIDQYLKTMSDKLTINDRFRQDISLTDLSKQIYNESITMQFLNFYNKAAVVAAMLDIRLLELSGGKRGLREVFLELLDKYGKDKPFPEDDFFKIFVDITYPEIQQFINDYIKGITPLPYAEYMAKLGFKYIDEVPSSDTTPTPGAEMTINDKGELIILSVSQESRKAGLQAGDVLIKVMGQDVNMENIRPTVKKIRSMKVGDPVELIVRRGDTEIPLTITLQQKMDRHIFEEMENPAEEQLKLRDAWSKNL